MTHAARPTQIAAILKAIETEYPDDMGAFLEKYIADLEARQPKRPAQIDTILQSIDSDHPLDMGVFLKAYIFALEAGQGTMSYGKSGTLRDPKWQYWHGVKRAQQRRERALRKQHNYQ
jgi:hypothetical protein